MSGGNRYLATVEGVDKLSLDKGVQVIKALSGKPYLQVTDTLLGRPISITLEKVLDADHDAIVAIIQAFITSGTAITLNITDAPFPNVSNLNVVPDEEPVRYKGNYITGKLLDVSYHFLTA